jgi:hypothetical protein
MDRSRIVIATTAPDLPAPHFDDEATLVSARQVVPIAKARLVERKRAAFWISLILLSSAACGGLGAIGVNYFEHRRQTASVPASQNEIASQTTQTRIPNNSDSTQKTETAAGGPTASASLQPVAAPPAKTNQPNDSSATVLSQASSSQATANQAAAASEPGQLVRKRRVHPLTRNDVVSSGRRAGKNDRGASRIKEIFEGQGPP